jgi:hypothetical protein
LFSNGVRVRLDETYIAVDRRYQDLNDGFNIAQAWYEIYLLFIFNCLLHFLF